MINNPNITDVRHSDRFKPIRFFLKKYLEELSDVIEEIPSDEQGEEEAESEERTSDSDSI